VGRRDDPVCSPDCGQIVINNEDGTVIINVNCSGGSLAVSVDD
jgi:hypothetical protein